jgi:hypothetical protein
VRAQSVQARHEAVHDDRDGDGARTNVRGTVETSASRLLSARLSTVRDREPDHQGEPGERIDVRAAPRRRTEGLAVLGPEITTPVTR